MSFGGFGAATQAHNPNKDIEVPQPPSDGVSSLAFSPTANFLVATSWSGQCLCWDVQPQSGQVLPKAGVNLTKPVLCSAWNGDGSSVFVGGCDNGVQMWNLATNQQQQIGQHQAPVRHMSYISQMNMLVTGSWDRTLKYWDLRSPNPVHTQQLPERVYAMDCTHPLLVVGTADRDILLFNLANPQQVFKTIKSPLKYQTRSISCFPDATGYLVGSVEGRVAVQHVDDSLASKNFTFKCHRNESDVFAVNSMSFHPQHHTFVTAGADGAYNFWDKDSKQRLKAMAKSNAPIPCGTFNRDGSLYAYAVSYDWSRGAAEHNPVRIIVMIGTMVMIVATAKNHILLHVPQEAEVKGRARTPGRR